MALFDDRSTAGRPSRQEALERQKITCGTSTDGIDTLRMRAAQVARGLQDTGLGPGDRVAILLRNCLEFLEITLGAGNIGAYATPINWHLKVAEVAYILDDCLPRAIFVHDDLLDLVPSRWIGKVEVIVIETSESLLALYKSARKSLAMPMQRYAVWRDANPPSYTSSSAAPDNLMYTSGTTGRPKGVERQVATPDQHLRMKAIRARLYELDEGGRALLPGPLYHALPNHFALYALGCDYLEIMERFDAEQLLAIIERERITCLVMVPIMFVRLLALPAGTRGAYDLSSLTSVLHGGGPCPVDVKTKMIEWWGPIIKEYYGGTETGPLTVCTSAEWLAHPGTCGKPLPEVTLRIIDHTGVSAPPGETGEIYAKLHCCADFTYRGDPEKRARAGLGELVSLGDIGRQDEEGYLFLCGRAQDMIISGGVNIYPAEIEAALLQLRGVNDCAVIGVPDPEWGEAVVAFVASDTQDGPWLQQGLREAIAGFKVPREIIVVPSLERDASGKLRKNIWRQRYLESASPSDAT